MKTCENCHRTYDDSSFFCPECGKKLVVQNSNNQPTDISNRVTVENGNSKKDTYKELVKSKTEEWDTSDNVLMRWLPSLISICGLLIAWYFSALVGFGFSVCGIIFGAYSSNELNKLVSLMVGIITVLGCLVSLA